MSYKNRSNSIKLFAVLLLATGILWGFAVFYKYYFLMDTQEILALNNWAWQFTKNLLGGAVLLIIGVIILARR
jgi:hypothetical protein